MKKMHTELIAVPLVALFLAAASTSQAQVTVTSDQLGFGLGVERNFFAGDGGLIAAAGLALETGGPRHWDFTEGVSDDVVRTRVVLSGGTGQAGLFPDAELAEEMRFGAAGELRLTYYNLTGAGRELHGFYDPVANPDFPQVVFSPPWVDYVAQIEFGNDWGSTSTSRTEVTLLGGTRVGVEVGSISTFEVDAYGTMDLPGGLRLIEVLRINGLTAVDLVADIFGTPTPLGTIFVRTYTWVSPEFGLVAQLVSTAVQEEPPPNNFENAAQFLRMFELVSPPRVTGLEIALVDGEVNLTWNPEEAGTSFEVLCSPDLRGWQILAEVVGGNFSTAISGRKTFFQVRRVTAEVGS